MRGSEQCPHCGFRDTRLTTIHPTDPSGNLDAAAWLLILGCSGLLFAVPIAWVIADYTGEAALVVGVISAVIMLIAMAWMRGRPLDPAAQHVWICENCLRTWGSHNG